MLSFEDIDLKHASGYILHGERMTVYASDYSFPILWGWGGDYGYQVAIENGEELIWIRQTVPEAYNLAPVGNWERDDWARLIRERYGEKCEFWLVPERLLEIWQKQMGSAINETESDRGNWEYIYNIHDLATLAGNRYMKKRNRVNQFRRTYDYSYKPITCAIIPDVQDFHDAWCEANGCASTPALQRESHGIRRILGHWGEIPNLRGGVIEAGGAIVAYTIGELAGKHLLVHFEKASYEYNSAYQVINKEFLVHMLEQEPWLVTVNREEDMNDPGLREAKMSYLPTNFIKKYRVKISF